MNFLRSKFLWAAVWNCTPAWSWVIHVRLVMVVRWKSSRFPSRDHRSTDYKPAFRNKHSSNMSLSLERWPSLKVLDSFGYCQIPVFSPGVSIHMHIICGNWTQLVIEVSTSMTKWVQIFHRCVILCIFWVAHQMRILVFDNYQRCPVPFKGTSLFPLCAKAVHVRQKWSQNVCTV